MIDPSALPGGWSLVPLGELLTAIDSGKSFKCEERPPEAHEVGVIKVSAVSWGEYQESESKTCVDAERIEPNYFVRPGDFLFSRANTIDLVGACVIVGRVSKRLMLSDKILRFHFAAEELKPWVLQFLRSKAGRDQIELLASGNQESMRNIGQERLRQIQIPLPPSSECESIGFKLDELLSQLAAASNELSTAWRKLGRLRQSLLKSAVEGVLTAGWRQQNPETDPALIALSHWQAKVKRKATQPEPWPGFRLPENWAWATVDQLTRSQRYGTSAKTTTDAGVPILRMGNIQNGSLLYDSLKYLPESHPEFPTLFAHDGELLFNRTNSPELVGKCAVFRAQPHPVSFASYLIGVVLGDACVPEYVAAVINSAYGRQWVAGVVTQQVGQANVNGSKLAALTLPLPPVAEQEEIARLLAVHLQGLDDQLAFVEHGLKMAEAQRQNILRSAFSGQLVPQDPNDEPASVLLERIRSQRPASEAAAKRKPGRPARVAV